MLVTVLSLASFVVSAKQVAGVQIDDGLMLVDKKLSLNGAGIRTKFVFDIYVAAFYTVDSVSKISDINMTQPMRMAMHFVYDEVSKEKLTDAWDDGFEDNISSSELAKLKDRIQSFNALFETVKKGDVILLDYLPVTGTTVTINSQQKGIVQGSDFYLALLMIWLGEDPVGDDLKDALLGKTETDDD